MHFALPPRKTSHPPPYAARSSRNPILRRARLQLGLFISCGIFLVYVLLARVFASSGRVPSGTPEVVIITTLDESAYSKEYIDQVKDNRRGYAAQHGYTTFFPKVTDYDLQGAPLSWSRIPSVRHALTLHPHSTYFFYLDQNALIMNPSLRIDSHIMERSRLESLMLKDKPVVPPDSVIRTFSHLKGHQIDLVLTQDREGLAQGSFIVRQGDWAKFFLDSWFDPLYRSYNFQKAEGHALHGSLIEEQEHVVQWHPTLLSKLALIPQQIMNSYNPEGSGNEGSHLYKDGDFIVRFLHCDSDPARSCEKEMEPFHKEWHAKQRQNK
ncbi:MAG: hypothetical protein M1827_005053 [Pycnora praestabilis]|nr:MAG: hypothetical protein M1827_005053 [Pycnora praestabilis]